MGLNYSFNLYYRLEDLGNALLETAKFGRPGERVIEVTLPNGSIIQLPFTSRFKTEPLEIKCTGYNEGNHTCFDIGLLFPDNPDVTQYQQDLSKRSNHPFNPDDFLVGTIYLHVFCGKIYVEMNYKACCTSMSLLFLDSKGIQEQFLELASVSGALGGVIDIEEIDVYRSLLNPDFKLPIPRFTLDEEGDYGGDWNYMIDIDTHVPAILQKLNDTKQNL